MEETDPKGSECSEEEIFEGYVFGSDNDPKNGCDQWVGLTGETEDIPLHVLTELKSVLTVRNEEKTRRRLLRQKTLPPAVLDNQGNRAGHAESHDQPQQSHDQHVIPRSSIIHSKDHFLQDLATTENLSASSTDKPPSSSHTDHHLPPSLPVANLQLSSLPAEMAAPHTDFSSLSAASHTDHLPPSLPVAANLQHSSLPAQMAAAVRSRRKRITEDVFS